MMNRTTYSAKPADISRNWYILDASELPLGRLATEAAQLLIGKKKPQFTRHIDCGDYVIITNAAQLVVTSSKKTTKMYHNHSGFPGGLRSRSLQEIMDKNPAEAVTKAIRGMLPVNKLRDARLARLKVYAGDVHNHDAQKPQQLSLRKAEK